MTRKALSTWMLMITAWTGCGVGMEGQVEYGELGATSETLVLDSLSRRQSPTVCWVRPDGLTPAQITAWDAARVRAEGFIDEWDANSAVNLNWTGLCPGPTLSGNYLTDIRILLADDGAEANYPRTIPGCTIQETSGNWGSFPSEAATRIKCKYNAHFQMWMSRNNFLHEAGHTIGFGHEHVRFDNPDTLCPGADVYQPPSNPYLSYYDVDSVMHYNYVQKDEDGDGVPDPDPWSGCPAPGNWGSTGLSAGDRLGVEMTYPFTYRREANGKKLLRTDQVIAFKYDWRARDAHTTWFKNSSWRLINGSTVYPNNVIDPSWSPAAAATYALEANFVDPFGTTHTVEDVVEVLTPRAHTARISPVLL